jgi:hypothetical protein
MATRSEIIKKAQRKIATGGATGAAADQFWTDEHWGDYFQTACEMVQGELVDNEQNYFMSEATLTPSSPGVFALPSDFHALLWLKETDSDQNIYEADILQEEEQVKEGFTIENDNIRLTNFQTEPTSLTLKYYHSPKEIGDWDGTDDTNDAAHTPDSPLNSASGARLLSEIIVMLARAKDESMTPDQQAVASSMIDNFVQRLGRRVQMEPQLLGIQY